MCGPELIEQLPPLFGRFVHDEYGIGHATWNSDDITKYETFGASGGQFLALGNAIDFL
jgi:hypothetical protein